MTVAHVGGHGRGFPGLAPIRNSCELRGLCCRSYFGPRTCGRGITSSSKRFGALNQGFPSSPLQCRQGRTRMGGWVTQRKCVRCMQWLCCVFGIDTGLKFREVAFGALVLCIRGHGIIHRAHKTIQGDECRPRRSSWLRFP